MNRYDPAGNPTPTFTRLPTMERIAEPGTTVAGLGVAYGPVVERFWLRPTPTFNRVGPEYPPGTEVAIMERAELRRGRFGLYLVGVGIFFQGFPTVEFGWAALSEADVASVLGFRNDVDLLRTYGKSLDGKLDPLPPE